MLSRLACFSFLTVIAIAQSGCNYDILKVNGRPLPTPNVAGQKPMGALDFESLKTRILEPRCFDCHDSGSSKGDLSDYANVMREYVTPGAPQASELFTMLKGQGGDMPRKAAQLPDDEVAAIRAWIEAGAPEKIVAKPTEPTSPAPAPEPEPVPEPGPQPNPQPEPNPVPAPEPLPVPNPQPAPGPAPIEPTYASVSSVLAVKCVMCHSGATPKADLDVTTLDSMLKWTVEDEPDSKFLAPGDSSKSLLYTIIRDEEMPRKKDIKAGKVLPVTPEELEAIKTWIDTGAAP